MKHTWKITALLLGMFILTQFIGLYVVNYYSAPDKELPLGMEPPAVENESDYYSLFIGIIVAFVIAIALVFLLSKFHIDVVLKLWFFIVVIIALIVSFLTIIPPWKYALILAAVIAIPLSFFKIYKKSLIVHNLTELLVYPGIAAVFVPILNLYTLIFLLILISVYDAWAVWHSGVMQKMAKYQINKLNIFSGFFVPYMTKELRAKIKKMRELRKIGKLSKNYKEKKVKVSLAILGGGDVIFPIIASGIIMNVWGFWHAIFVMVGATIGLSYLFFFAKKKKFYPAMPFITIGIFLGMMLGWLIL